MNYHDRSIFSMTGSFGFSCACVLKTLRFKTLRYRDTKGKRPMCFGGLRAKTQRNLSEEFFAGEKIATAIAKDYTESAQKCLFCQGKRGSKMVRIVKNNSGSKIVRLQAPYIF